MPVNRRKRWPLPRLRDRSHSPAGVRRAGQAGEHAMANGGRCEGERSRGKDGLRQVDWPINSAHTRLQSPIHCRKDNRTALRTAPSRPTHKRNPCNCRRQLESPGSGAEPGADVLQGGFRLARRRTPFLNYRSDSRASEPQMRPGSTSKRSQQASALLLARASLTFPQNGYPPNAPWSP